MKVSPKFPPVKWFIGEKHPVCGEVVMCGITQGEPYRWFKNELGTVSMIPLSALLEEEHAA